MSVRSKQQRKQRATIERMFGSHHGYLQWCAISRATRKALNDPTFIKESWDRIVNAQRKLIAEKNLRAYDLLAISKRSLGSAE